jgi:hypothetical protein
MAQLTAEQLKLELGLFGLEKLLCALVGHCVPTDAQAEVLFQRRINYERYVYDNTRRCVALLDKALGQEELIAVLGDAVWALSRDAQAHHFAVPQPGEEFDVVQHDMALESFRALLVQYVQALQQSKSSTLAQDKRAPLWHLLMCFARSMFEMRQFQAPPRRTAEEALRDAQGETELWPEYLRLWGLLGDASV